jgi:hypothetical protein
MELDKRQHSRVGCEIDSSFRNLDAEASKPISETLIQDISEGGIRFRTNHFIPVHNKLLFRIQMPNSKFIEAVARPAWIREIPNLRLFDIGAQFISLSDEDRTIIKEFASSIPSPQ